MWQPTLKVEGPLVKRAADALLKKGGFLAGATRFRACCDRVALQRAQLQRPHTRLLLQPHTTSPQQQLHKLLTIQLQRSVQLPHASTMTCTLRKLFSDTNLDELCTPQQVVILKDTATVEQALRVGGQDLARAGSEPGRLWCLSGARTRCCVVRMSDQ
jgi:hypothetical protein